MAPRLVSRLVALAFVLVATPAAWAAGGADEVIVATSADVPSLTSSDGTRRYEAPWLQAGDRDVAVSPDSTRMAFSSDRDGSLDIHVADLATGDVRRVTSSPDDERRPAWSPDGTRLAWDVATPDGREVLVAAADGSGAAPVAASPGNDLEPTWSPDGTQIAFVSGRSGVRALWRVALADGAVVAVPSGVGEPSGPAWSPDGRRIAYTARRSARLSHIRSVELTTGAVARITRGPVVDAAPEWSPDGGAIAFARDTGRYSAIHVVSSGGGRVRVVGGTADQSDPDWSRAAPLLSETPELLPDLDQRAPTGVQVLFRDGAYRLGFDSRTENIGDGALWLRGQRIPGGLMRADQIIALRSGGTRRIANVGRMRFEDHEPHFHWHLKDYVRYELRRASDQSFVVSDRKSGFCLVDRYGRTLAQIPGVRPPRFTGDCGARRPNAVSTETGNSRGYADVYPAYYHGQDVALDGVPAGLYVLVQRANPAKRIRETRYGNNAASVLVRLSRSAAGVPSVTVVRRCETSELCPAV